MLVCGQVKQSCFFGGGGKRRKEKKSQAWAHPNEMTAKVTGLDFFYCLCVCAREKKKTGRVGKTSLFMRYMRDLYSDSQQSTVQASYLKKKLNIDGQSCSLSIWVSCKPRPVRLFEAS